MSTDPFQIIQLAPNMVEVILADNTDLDISVTDKIDQALHQIAPNRRFYQLVMASGPYVVNPEMRHAMSEGDTGTKLLAIAWVSPDEKANREQEAIVSQLSLPVPIRFFSRRADGLAWLNQLAKK